MADAWRIKIGAREYENTQIIVHAAVEMFDDATPEVVIKSFPISCAIGAGTLAEGEAAVRAYAREQLENSGNTYKTGYEMWQIIGDLEGITLPGWP